MPKKLILSIVLAIAAYYLGIVAEATRDSGLAIYMASCFSKIFCYVVAVPLAHSAGKTIRKELNIPGMPGLRFVGWILFGVAVIHFLSFFIWGAYVTPLPDGQITIDSAIFFMASAP